MPGLYVHIPFCAAKCCYCDFVSFAETGRIGAYLAALGKEMGMCARALPQRRYDTVFIGGGTPSVLPHGALARLMDAIKSSFAIAPDAEVTVEANPGTVDEAKLEEYLSSGINRLSFGLQSADDGLLHAIGRIHTFRDFESSFALARRAGFSNISADIMYGLPGQSAEAYFSTIKTLAAMGPEHISAYSLILEEGTPLFAAVEAGEESVPDEDETFLMHSGGMELLEKLGYGRYEISNYSKPGFEARHNINYWENGEYLGLGLNAHSAMRLEKGWTRWSNGVRLSDYIADCNDKMRPVAHSEVIPREEEMFESAMLGLRMVRGVDASAFLARFGTSFDSVFGDGIRALRKKGWLEEADGCFRLRREGLDMQNSALLLLMDG